MKKHCCVMGFLLLIVLAVCPASLFGQTFVWTQTIAPNNATWTGIASSADGTKLAACCNYPTIAVYTSINTGYTWTKVPTPSTQNPWTGGPLNCMASSADGNELVVGGGTTYSTTNSGYIYYSNSGGSLWWQTYIPGELFWENWTSIAESTSGATMVAAGHYTIFVSTDTGSSWSSRANAPNPRGYWKTVACSADGKKLVATDVIQIYTSTNTGNSWYLTSAPSNQWSAIASSSDGTKLVACNDYSIGRIYTSTNSGLAWTQTIAPSNTFWSAVTSSTDGTKLAACSYSGNIYFSTNSGLTWSSNSFPTRVSAMASSADGTKLFAAFNGGGISIGQLIVPAQNFSASTIGSGLNLQFTGLPNCPYILFAATSLNQPITWQPVVTNLTDANGRWVFTDTNFNQYQQRFYTASQ
jgi:photosystem II stability/assembly factor-like uncharacterized protein